MTDPGTPAGGGGTSTLDRELEELLNGEITEDGDHDRYSHYVPVTADSTILSFGT